MRKIYFLGILFFCFNNSFAIVIGSNNTVNRYDFVQKFSSSDADNTILGFSKIFAGFMLEDHLTSCTYDAFFPISGIITLNKGSLYLNQDLYLYNNINITNSGSIYGQSFFLEFAKRDDPIYIPVDSNSFLFDNINLVFNSKVILNGPIYISGSCILEGNGNILELSDSASIIITANSSLFLKNLIVKNISGSNFACLDDTGTFIFRNVNLVLDSNMDFNYGNFYIEKDVVIQGECNMNYKSSKESFIMEDSSLTIDYGTTFSYNPSNFNKNLLSMEGATSKLRLTGGTLYVGSGGLQLTKGILAVDKKSYLITEGNNGLILGDGSNLINDLTIVGNFSLELLAGSLIDLRNIG